jgi:predicted signal transduction protein with EAL and GGDEF domain
VGGARGVRKTGFSPQQACLWTERDSLGGCGKTDWLRALNAPTGHTQLRIDVDFVRNLPADTSNQHLVRAIAGLAKDFGYETIAEGVEDAETLAMLVDYGVDFAQGFHIGRPSPITNSHGTVTIADSVRRLGGLPTGHR